MIHITWVARQGLTCELLTAATQLLAFGDLGREGAFSTDAREVGKATAVGRRAKTLRYTFLLFGTSTQRVLLGRPLGTYSTWRPVSKISGITCGVGS